MMTLLIVLFFVYVTGIPAEPTVAQDHSSVLYHQDLILKEIEGVGRLQCVHRCKRDEECKHIAYKKDSRNCTLLKDGHPIKEIVGCDETKNTGKEGGEFFVESALTVFSPHQDIDRKWYFTFKHDLHLEAMHTIVLGGYFSFLNMH